MSMQKAKKKRVAQHRGRRWVWAAGSALLLAAAAAGTGLYTLSSMGITPRSLGPYLERRSAGHNAVIEGIGRTAREWLLWADRGEQLPGGAAWAGTVGMQRGGMAAGSGKPAPAVDEVLVSDSAGLLRAVAAATPGQVITLLPGRYQAGRTIEAFHPGRADAPIVVRAVQPGSVQLEIGAGEGFRVSAPYWRFENLSLRGSCPKAYYCEHAFHVVGDAHHFAAVNNLIVDFDAHFKINAEKGRYPDHGLIESNTLRNDSVRLTSRPVTPIDLVTASDWIVRRNLISDFIKGDGDRISYGAFAKGGGANNLFEQNIVICEDRLRGAPGQRIGLSLGGGGTGKEYCRDGKCITEQTGSTLRANLVASCSDDGIYLNAAARSRLQHNTLVDTGGITVRFPESSADLAGNLVDGMIRSRDDGIVRLDDNLYTSAARLYLGSHPYRALFRDPLALDFRWREPAARRANAGEIGPDLCGGPRPAQARYGAFEDFGACLSQP
jgi:parallel beta-helix repeat protein